MFRIQHGREIRSIISHPITQSPYTREEIVRMHLRYKDLEIEEPDTNHLYYTGTCGCNGDQVPGLDHFSLKEDEINEAVRSERAVVTNKRCGFVFVVWSSPGHCKM